MFIWLLGKIFIAGFAVLGLFARQLINCRWRLAGGRSGDVVRYWRLHQRLAYVPEALQSAEQHPAAGSDAASGQGQGQFKHACLWALTGVL